MCLLLKMSKALKIFGIALLISLLNVSFTRLGFINLVWILTAVFLLTENESFAISFAMVSGFMFDVFMHNSVGVTSLSILIGILGVLALRAIVSGDNIVFKSTSIVVLFIFAFSAKALIDILLEDTSYRSLIDFVYWWKYLISHALLVGIFTVLLGGMRGVISSEKKIKLKKG